MSYQTHGQNTGGEVMVLQWLSEIAWKLTDCQETLVALKRDIDAVITEIDSERETLMRMEGED